MGVTVKRTFIRPKGREEYESKGMSTSQQISVVGQEVVAQGGGERYTAGRGIDISNGVISVTQTPIVYNAGENITISGYTISSPNSVQSAKVKRIVPIKKEDYDALTAKSIDILYLVYVPKPSGSHVEYQQTTDVPYQGAIINDNSFLDYFDYRVYCDFDDGSSLDVTSGSTIIVNNGYAVDISANTSPQRIEAARPLVVAYLPEAYTSTTQIAVSAYIPIYQAGLVKELVNARLEGTWVTDVPAEGGIITSANCTWDLYYIYSDETEELHTHYPSLYPIEIQVEANDTLFRKQLDSFQAITTVYIESQHHTNYVTTWVTPYQEAGNTVPNNMIAYQTTNSAVLYPRSAETINTTISSNTYYDDTDIGVMVFNDDVTTLGNISNQGVVGDYGVFQGLDKLKRIIFPNSITQIGAHAFEGCGSLSSVTIPNSVTTLGYGTFNGCSGLQSVVVGSGITTYGPSYGGDLSGETFNGCYALSSVTLNQGLTIIGPSMFMLCRSLSSITLPDSVTTIGEAAFEQCTALSSVTFGSGITEIHSLAFADCTSLSSITIPDSVSMLGYFIVSGNTGPGVFYGCSALSSVVLPSGITYLEKNLFKGCSNLKTVSIPQTVTIIGQSAFGGAGLETISIPTGVTTIYNWAFSSTHLSSITIPVSTTYIGDYVFADSSSLTSLNYSGTIAQWNSITKGSSWTYHIAATVVHCTDGDVPIN